MMCPAESPTIDSLKQRPISVLIVESEVLIRLSISEFLRENGLHVVEASSTAEARSVLLADVAIDIVFADANLSDEDGLAPWLADNHPEVALLLAAWASSRPPEAPQGNVLARIEKPYTPERVLQSIRDIAERRAV
ncbi:MAG TPA: response regulator [Caulobacterales bacterium]|nr:response regulator [Caulobacterales bacterium]